MKKHLSIAYAESVDIVTIEGVEFPGKYFRDLAAAQSQNQPVPGGDIRDLSSREMQVLTMFGHGVTQKEISHKLEIDQKTVSSHIAAIKRKFGVSSNADVVKLAVYHRLTKIIVVKRKR